jgi:hypothetical protein
MRGTHRLAYLSKPNGVKRVRKQPNPRYRTART